MKRGMQGYWKCRLLKNLYIFAGVLEPGAGILAAVLYFWQMPHFLALAWLHREDYMRGGYAMLSRYSSTPKSVTSQKEPVATNSNAICTFTHVAMRATVLAL